MKKLHKLFITSYVGPFFVTLFIVLFLLVMQFLWKYMDDMIGKGLGLDMVAQLLFFASANLVPMALPLAVLLASIMTFGNFGEKYELVAIKSAGISLYRAMAPLIVVSLLIAVLSFGFMNYVWPVANLKMKTLLYDITHKKPALDIKEKVYYKEIDKYVIRVESKGTDGQSLYGVSIYDHSKGNGNTKIIRADSGKMTTAPNGRNLVFELYDGTSYEEVESDNETKDNYPVFRTTFKKEKVLFDMSSFDLSKTDESIFKDSYEMLNLEQIKNEIDTSLNKQANAVNKFKTYLKNQSKLFKDSLLIKHNNITEMSKNDELSWFSSLSPQDKLTVVQTATTLVRSAKSFSEASKMNMTSQKTRVRKLKIEWHRKFTIAYMCLILFFVGAPMGAITKKGGLGMPVLISIVFFIFYYVISITGEKLIKQGSMEPIYGMWMAALLLTPIGIWLTYKSANDSKLLSFDSYVNFFKKVFPSK